MSEFATNYNQILKQIQDIDPISYSRSRNFLNGNVTRLSPYLTHGVISLNYIKKHLLSKYTYKQVEKLIFELAWKEYFLRVWETKCDDTWTDLKNPQNAKNNLIPTNIVDAKTGITAIDQAILELYEGGYMHNHARMWTASLTTNIAHSHWKIPSQWMYYHLLDGDLASNTLSWQWVAGTFSSKKYYANQENINKYANTRQTRTFLDISYDRFEGMPTPTELEQLQELDLRCELNKWVNEYLENNPTMKYEPSEKAGQNLVLFHPWCVDPIFGNEIENADKTLLLEPSHFSQYPMSIKRINFILDLAKNIDGIKVLVGEITELETNKYNKIITKKYPAINHWKTIPSIQMIEPDYMFPTILGYFGSFMSYWKKCEKTYMVN